MEKLKLKKKIVSKKKLIKTKVKVPMVVIGDVEDIKNKKNKSNSSKVGKRGRSNENYDDRKIKNRIAKNKARILEELKKTFGIVTNAIAKVRIDNTTFYKWFKEDKEFAKAVEDIQEGFDVIVEDKLKQKIIQNDGHSIRFYLSHRVKKYKPKVGLGFDEEAEPIKMIITEYDPNYPENSKDEL